VAIEVSGTGFFLLQLYNMKGSFKVLRMTKVLVYNVYMKGEDCVGILLLQGKGDNELNLLVFSCVCTLYACK
jgi:hypothetical protein